MEQIARAIESINQASDRSVEGTRQVDQEITRLQDLALRLGSLVQAESKE
jgi:methyl-accepting chemotaxis protein